MFGAAAGLDSPGLYRSVSGGGLDTRQLADAGEQLLLLLLDMLCNKAAADVDN